MGNSLLFSPPKCNYSSSSLQPFYKKIPIIEQHYSSKSSTSRLMKREIPSLYIRSGAKATNLIVYFHGNCDDLGRLYPHLLEYFERFQVPILAPEYRGYGLHKGKPTTTDLIRDAKHAIEYATSSDGLGYNLENVILIGRSLGTALAIQIAARYPNLKGMILISPFTSVRDVAKHAAGPLSRMFIPNVLESADIIEDVNTPILCIHGKKDDVIPYTHSIKLYEKAVGKKRLVLRETMSHNKSDKEKDIFQPIESFLLEDLELTDLPCFKLKTTFVGERFFNESLVHYGSCVTSLQRKMTFESEGSTIGVKSEHMLD